VEGPVERVAAESEQFPERNALVNAEPRIGTPLMSTTAKEVFGAAQITAR
jgi:hypothetical protein